MKGKITISALVLMSLAVCIYYLLGPTALSRQYPSGMQLQAITTSRTDYRIREMYIPSEVFSPERQTRMVKYIVYLTNDNVTLFFNPDGRLLEAHTEP